MTAVAIAVLAAAGWLLTARRLYGRWRGTGAGGGYCPLHGQRKYATANGRWPACCHDEDPLTDGLATLWAVTAALFWPCVVMVALVRFRPPPTVAEREAEAARLKARVGELEAELGIH
jgi:hypothetical protein